ncbi:hypothetical protein EJ06DRAFT_552826 [Trichodelitschia bisporula]|uniref:Uncharacterized protein n=1 Tax=Trichodelitschia bisporula TaxID=703511 RepID=A0A6G1IAU9_9PEZI|nr:hypothetical protein EJ06DRAFT_552826 [Trichodelitschia bisporula]
MDKRWNSGFYIRTLPAPSQQQFQRTWLQQHPRRLTKFKLWRFNNVKRRRVSFAATVGVPGPIAWAPIMVVHDRGLAGKLDSRQWVGFEIECDASNGGAAAMGMKSAECAPDFGE